MNKEGGLSTIRPQKLRANCVLRSEESLVSSQGRWGQPGNPSLTGPNDEALHGVNMGSTQDMTLVSQHWGCGVFQAGHSEREVCLERAGPWQEQKAG